MIIFDKNMLIISPPRVIFQLNNNNFFKKKKIKEMLGEGVAYKTNVCMMLMRKKKPPLTRFSAAGAVSACTHLLMSRSADEPMTTYVTCANCKNHWKF
jgi:DNA-directed RNA polymerase subunit M/transcription elongation factor TFIIS